MLSPRTPRLRDDNRLPNLPFQAVFDDEGNPGLDTPTHPLPRLGSHLSDHDNAGLGAQAPPDSS